MRRLMVMVLVAAGLLAAGCASTAPAPSPVATSTAVRQLAPADFAVAISGDRVTINVHIPEQGSLPNTDLTVPFDQIESRAAELPQDRDTPLAIYCMTGSMSQIAGQTLTDMGYRDVVELRGGMQAWRQSGLALLPAG